MGCGRKRCGEGSANVASRKHHGCICEVVETILELQNHASHDEDFNCGTSCFLEPLGGINRPSRHHADSRVFMLLNSDGTPFRILYYDKKHGWFETHYFRVEDVFGDCCATLRAVKPADDQNDPIPLYNDGILDVAALNAICKFVKTDNCVTVDLSRFAGIQCIADVDLNIKKG